MDRTEDVDAAFREAVRAVQARQLGCDPVIVRAALEEELATRGIAEAAPDRVERMTRMLVATQGPFASFRVMHEMWNFVGEVRDAVKGPEVPEWLKPPPGREVGIPTSENPSGPGEIFEVAEVELADGVQPFLTRAFEATYDPTYAEEGEAEESNCKVWIDTRRLPASGAPLHADARRREPSARSPSARCRGRAGPRRFRDRCGRCPVVGPGLEQGA